MNIPGFYRIKSVQTDQYIYIELHQVQIIERRSFENVVGNVYPKTHYEYAAAIRRIQSAAATAIDQTEFYNAVKQSEKTKPAPPPVYANQPTMF